MLPTLLFEEYFSPREPGSSLAGTSKGLEMTLGANGSTRQGAEIAINNDCEDTKIAPSKRTDLVER